MPRLRLLPALLTGALIVPAAVAAGCGGIPGDAVAEVDGTSIKEEKFDHWMKVAAKQNSPSGIVPDKDDDFKQCIKAARKAQPKPAKGQPNPTEASLKKQCQQQYDAMRDQVMQLLISYEWLKNEADERDVSVTDEEVEKEFAKAKKQSFPKDTEKQYAKYLKDSGQAEEDLIERVRLDLLSKKIRDKVLKGKTTVTDAEVRAFYDKNKANFGQPEQRDLHVVVAKTKAKADQAKAELEAGKSFKAVAKKYSIDQTSKSAGGKLPNVAKGRQGDKAFDTAVFGAKKGQLKGPVKTQYGYYVFEVDKITAPKQQSFEKVKDSIKQQLVAQKQQKALDDFSKDFEKRWKDKTDCRDEYRTATCKNAPKTTSTAAPGGATPPSGQAPQQPAPSTGGSQAPDGSR